MALRIYRVVFDILSQNMQPPKVHKKVDDLNKLFNSLKHNIEKYNDILQLTYLECSKKYQIAMIDANSCSIFKNSTLLYLASRYNQIYLVKLLLSHGADPNIMSIQCPHKVANDLEVLPIFIAMQFKLHEVAYELLNDPRLNINSIGVLGQSILNFAMSTNTIKLVYKLLERGVDIHANTTINGSVINSLILSFQNIYIGLKSNTITFDNNYDNNSEIVILRALLEAGADPNTLDISIIQNLYRHAVSTIAYAVSVKDKQLIIFYMYITKLLLAHGLNIDLYNDDITCGYEARDYTCSCSNHRTYTKLNMKKAKFRCSGCNFIVYCCKKHQQLDYSNHKDVCKMLLIKSIV